MALPKRQKPKKFGKGEILQEAAPKLASSLSSCLDNVKMEWQKNNNNIASLWQNWSVLAGEPLASNCIPLSIKRGVLVIGANHPQWLQALQYNRSQLLARLKAQGNEIREIRIQQYHAFSEKKQLESESSIWARHPSRIDVHGIKICKYCQKPASVGEITRWNKCSFCRRNDLSK